MTQFFLFLHLLGAVAMGFYLLLPFLSARLGKLSGPALEAYAGALYGVNRWVQLLLIIQLLTGGYLMGEGDYPKGWMIAIIVMLVLIGALSGIVGSRMKKLLKASAAGIGAGAAAGKAQLFSWILGICYLLMLLLMKNPGWF